jgi:hypothetical protein
MTATIDWELLQAGESLRLYQAGLSNEPRLTNSHTFAVSGEVAGPEYAYRCLGGSDPSRVVVLDRVLACDAQRFLGRRALLGGDHTGRLVKIGRQMPNGGYEVRLRDPRYTIDQHLATAIWVDRTPANSCEHVCIVFD